MKFLVGIGAFIVLLWLGAPFIAALFLAFAASVIVHFSNKQRDDRRSEDGTVRAQGKAPGQQDESIPDGMNAAALRAYLRALTMRVQVLEQELHALKKASPSVKPEQNLELHEL